jgi:spermidine/putrescine transport system substrate-binding protein
MDQLSRRKFLKGTGAVAALAATGGLTGILAACGDDDGGGTTAPTSTGGAQPGTKRAITIGMIGWAGQDDPSWKDPLEDQLNIKAEFKGALNMPELTQLVSSSPPGTYDLIGSYAVSETPRLYEQGLLQSLGKPSDWPLDQMVQDAQPSTDPVKGQAIFDGELYYIDARLDYEGLRYNPEKVPTEEVLDKGYDILFEDKYKGKIVVWDSFQQLMSLVAVTLGYESPFDLTAAEFAELRNKLLAYKNQIFFVPGFGENLQAHTDGSAWLGGIFQGDAGAAILRLQGAPVEVFFDPRGVLLSHEGYSLPVGADDPERILEAIRFFTSPEGQAALVQQQAWYSSPALPAAYELLPQSLKDLSFLKLESGKYVPKVGSGDFKIVDWVNPINPPVEEWLRVWDEFKAA